MKKVRRISIFTLCFLIIILSFITLSKKIYIIKQIEHEIPNAIFVTSSHNKYLNGKRITNYTFSNDEFDFDFFINKEKDYAGFDAYIKHCSYFQDLVDLKADEFNKVIINNKNIFIYDKTVSNPNKDIEQAKEDDKVICSFSSQYNYIPTFNFNFTINNFSEIDDVCSFLKELYEIIEKYVPDEKTKLVKGMVCVNIHLSPYDYSGKNIQIYSDCFYLNKKDIDIDW